MSNQPLPPGSSDPPSPPAPDIGAPFQDEVTRLTNIIMEQIGGTDVESALTVICGLAGQLVASLSEGRPSDVKAHADSLAGNIRNAAITKLLHDDEKLRKERTWH